MRQSLYSQLCGFRYLKKPSYIEKHWNIFPKKFPNSLYNFFNVSGGANNAGKADKQSQGKIDDYELDLISMRKVPKFKKGVTNDNGYANIARNIRLRKRNITVPKHTTQNDLLDSSNVEISIKNLINERKQRDSLVGNSVASNVAAAYDRMDGDMGTPTTTKPVNYRDEMTYDTLFSNILADDHSKLKDPMHKNNNTILNGSMSSHKNNEEDVMEKFNNLETVVKIMESKINNIETKSARKVEEIERKIEDLGRSNDQLKEKIHLNGEETDKLSSKSLQKIDEIFQSEDNLQILEDLLNDVKHSQMLERESKFREIRAYEWSKNKILHPDKTVFLPFYRVNSNFENSLNGYFHNFSNNSLFPTVSKKQIFAIRVKKYIKAFFMISGFGFISLLIFDILCVKF